MSKDKLTSRTPAQDKKTVTLVAALANLGLAIGKTACGIIAHSEALVADGIHSLSDLLTDIITIIAVKIAAQDADSDHPYGHARFETLATVILGMILMTAGAGILVSAVDRLQHPDALSTPGNLSIDDDVDFNSGQRMVVSLHHAHCTPHPFAINEG